MIINASWSGVARVGVAGAVDDGSSVEAPLDGELVRLEGDG
jgi:hypothetical protein